jgi:hypothetical protein
LRFQTTGVGYKRLVCAHQQHVAGRRDDIGIAVIIEPVGGELDDLLFLARSARGRGCLVVGIAHDVLAGEGQVLAQQIACAAADGLIGGKGRHGLERQQRRPQQQSCP